MSSTTMVGMMNGDDPYSFESQLESFRRSDQARETLVYVRCYLSSRKVREGLR